LISIDLAILGCLIPAIYGIYTDFKEHVLKNTITYPIIILGFIYSIYTHTFLTSLAGAGVMFIVLSILFKKGGIGGGDVKLATGIGMWFGIYNGILIMFFGSIMAIVDGMVRIYFSNGLKSRIKSWYMRILYKVPLEERVISEETSAEHIPYGAYISIAAWLLWLQQIF
jgi:leader peptidase (prepilin peptidase)/N-methyltransferase